MQIDSHQHFWALARGDYAWLTPELEQLYRDFQPEHLQPFLAENNVQQTILVQAAATVAETEYLLALAEQHDFIAGVVGWVDLDDPVAAVADLARLSTHPKLLGIRPMIQDIPDPGWILQSRFTPVFEQLLDLNLTFDALVLPVHLGNLLTLLQRHPQLKCVIDHGAKPGIATSQWQPWAEQLQALGRQTRCYCKLSGLLTEAGERTDDAAISHYIAHLFESFGPERLMWGSDWPVLTLAGEYSEWLQQCRRLCRNYTDKQQQAIFGDNAARFYGLAT